MHSTTSLLLLLTTALTTLASPILHPRQDTTNTKTYCLPTSQPLLNPTAYANLVKRVPTPYVLTAWGNPTSKITVSPASNSHTWLYSGNAETLSFSALFLCTYDDVDGGEEDKWEVSAERYLEADGILEVKCGSRAGGVVLFEGEKVAYGRGSVEGFDLTVWDGFNGELGERCKGYKKEFDGMQ